MYVNNTRLPLPSPKRQDGDGMETMNTSTVESTLPQQVPLKLPKSIPRNVDLHLGLKEPKFVPYEPYKGAVNPIIPKKKTKKISKRTEEKREEEQDVVTEQPQGIEETRDINMGKRALEKANDATLGDTERQLPNDEVQKMREEKSVLEEEMARMEADMRRLKEENSVLEGQLNTHIQVNAELKKLLVASVGEDMEARVHFLTEDKIKLGHDIIKFSQALNTDSEEKDKLSIQSDVWRSKYIASSVMVSELANSKATLTHIMDDALTTIQTLMDERQYIRNHLLQINSQMKSLHAKFDPKASATKQCEEGSLLDLSTNTRSLIESVSKSLLGSDAPHTAQVNAAKIYPTCTSGEEMANVLLSIPRDQLLCGMDSISQSLLEDCRGYRHRCPIVPDTNARLEKLTINCCKHCAGDIQVV